MMKEIQSTVSHGEGLAALEELDSVKTVMGFESLWTFLDAEAKFVADLAGFAEFKGLDFSGVVEMVGQVLNKRLTFKAVPWNKKIN